MDTTLPLITSISIPQVHLVTRDSLFSPKYAVSVTQVYEVHYSCSQDTNSRSVKRRYSEFHKFSNLIVHKDRTPLLTAFPKKKWIRSWTPQVVESRRQILETWLIEISQRNALKAYLLDFLGAAPVAEESHTNTPTPGELIITQALGRLAAKPNMRLATLEQFEKEFGEMRGPVNGDYVLAFVQKLVPMCGDNYLGCKAIDILAKLVTRESNRGYADVIRILRSLPVPVLREMHLEKHLLKSMKVDTGEESFRLTKLLSQEDPGKIQTLVCPNQLNFDTDALQVYASWISGTLASDREAVPVANLSWREVDCSDCLGLKILFNLTPDGAEIDTQLFVNSHISRVLELLTVAEERKRWDERTKDIVAVGVRGEPNYRMQLLFDMPGRDSFCTLECELSQDTKDHATLVLSSREEDQSLIKLKSVYTISTVRRDDDLSDSQGEDEDESEEAAVSLAMSDSETYAIPMRKTQCLITNKLLTNSVLSRAFTSDIIGEAQIFKNSWVHLKYLAEGCLVRGEPSPELNSAMERKAALGHMRLESFHDSGFYSPSEPRLSLSMSMRLTHTLSQKK